MNKISDQILSKSLVVVYKILNISKFTLATVMPVQQSSDSCFTEANEVNLDATLIVGLTI